jgi:hypothetical protein
MKKEIDIIDILLVIGIALFIFLVAWKIFGSSPILDMFVVGFSILFLILAIESRRDMKIIKNKINRLDDIYDILKERLKS